VKKQRRRNLAKAPSFAEFFGREKVSLHFFRKIAAKLAALGEFRRSSSSDLLIFL
jgi:hypothetical protein